MLEKISSGYKATVAVAATGVAATYGLYAYTQSIAIKHVPNGIWNSEAWTQDWGSDTVIASISIMCSGIVGLVTAFITPITFQVEHGIQKQKANLNEYEKFKLNGTCNLSYRGIYGANVSILEETIYELNKGKDNFIKYFEGKGQEYQKLIVGNIIKSIDNLDSSIEIWLEKHYAPIVEQTGIIGIGINQQIKTYFQIE